MTTLRPHSPRLIVCSGTAIWVFSAQPPRPPRLSGEFGLKRATAETQRSQRLRRELKLHQYPIFCLLLAVISLLGTSAALAMGQQSSSGSEAVIPLEGLDPVMLSQGKEVQGDMKYKVTRGRFQYIFATAENKAEFEKDPSKYEIQLDGHCARMGAPTGGNPDLFAVHNGRIYIFGSEECQKLFKATPEKYLEVAPTPKSPPTAEMLKRGQELIAKAVESLGGSKLDQLNSFQRKDVRQNDVRNTLLLAFPDSVRQETVRPTFTLVSVVTPSESFVSFNNTARAMDEDNRRFISKELNHEPIVLLRSRNKSGFKASAAGNEKLGDTTVERVDVELAEFTTTLGIDAATGRVLSQAYRGRGPGGVVGEIMITYSDFRAVEGMLLPFRMSATFDGQPFPALSGMVETATVNGKLDPDSFKKPTAKP
jgi:YHS domain-containing protein